MSILDRIQDEQVDRSTFAAVCGERTRGKTTIVGTLPGNTLLLQAAIKESGSRSALALAKQLGNKLSIDSFKSVEELHEILTALNSSDRFEHIYIDGLSAITEQLVERADIAKKMKTDNWSAFRIVGDEVRSTLSLAKGLTYPSENRPTRSVWFTVALKMKTNANGDATDCELDCKGLVSKIEILKMADAIVVCLDPKADSEGNEGEHRLLTKSIDPFMARIDGVLRDDNPTIIQPASLAEVLKLRGE